MIKSRRLCQTIIIIINKTLDEIWFFQWMYDTRYLIFLMPNISETQYFWDPILLWPNISETPYFWDQIFLRQNIFETWYFLSHLFLRPNISEKQYFYDPIFLRPDISKTRYFWDPINNHYILQAPNMHYFIIL